MGKRKKHARFKTITAEAITVLDSEGRARLVLSTAADAVTVELTNKAGDVCLLISVTDSGGTLLCITEPDANKEGVSIPIFALVSHDGRARMVLRDTVFNESVLIAPSGVNERASTPDEEG